MAIGTRSKIVKSPKYAEIMKQWGENRQKMSARIFHSTFVTKLDPGITLANFYNHIKQLDKEARRRDAIQSELSKNIGKEVDIVANDKDAEKHIYSRSLLLIKELLDAYDPENMSPKDAVYVLSKLKEMMQGDRKLDLLEKKDKREDTLVGIFLTEAIYGGITPENIEKLKNEFGQTSKIPKDSGGDEKPYEIIGTSEENSPGQA